MTVDQVMTRTLITLGPDQTLREAVALQQRHHIRHIPIVDGDSLIGIVTDRDVKRASPSLLSGIDQQAYDRVLAETHLAQVMTRNPFTVTPQTDLRDAVKVLIDRRFSALPVVERNKLVGILTVTDMLRAFHGMLGE